MQLHFTISKPPSEVFAHLTDMTRFVAAHPVIYRADALGDGRYRIHERMPIGLPLPFTYPATVTPDAPTHSVRMDATVFGLVRIEMRFQLSATAQGTLVREDVAITSRLPVPAVLEGVFREQHARLFAAIEQAA